MGIEFANTLFIFLFFRVSCCASIDLLKDSRMDNTSSDRWTTLGIETYSSGGYETESDYRMVNVSVQPTHDVETTARTKNQSNPCLNGYNGFCIHGICQYHSELKTISCICHTGFTGERCHSYSLESVYRKGYDLANIILPVVAVVLSISCLAIFGVLLVIRHQKKHKHDVKCEEKINLRVTPVHEL